MISSSFKGKMNSIPLALAKLKKYTKETRQTPTHVKLIYNVFDGSALIEGKYSNKVESSEITQSLPDSINFVFTQMINEYLLSYQKVFLSRIIIESDVDMLGVVFDSIKVTCRFKANLKNYAVSQSELLSEILDQTVDAERSEIIETPPTAIKLHLLRHKLRSIQIIYDYSKHEDYLDVYSQSFNEDFKLALLGLIKLYESDNSSHQASMRLVFDLKRRNKLIFEEGSIYPTQQLVYDAEKHCFKDQEIEHILQQMSMITSALKHVQISGLNFSLNHKKRYKLEFKLISAERPNNFLDLSKLDTVMIWNQNLSAIVDNYSIYSLSKVWLQNTAVNIEPSKNSWIIQFKKFDVRYNFTSIINENQIFDIVSAVANQIKDRAKVFRIEVMQEKRTTKMLKLDIQPNQPDQPIETKPLKLLDPKLNAEITHILDLSTEGFYLKEDIFKKQVK